VRGALAATAAYADVPGGIVTASAGNHGLGIAWAASRVGVQANIVVPETASAAKIEALRAFPTTLITHGTGYEAAEQHALHLAGDAGRYVSAYNDPYVIAGQSSMLVEILEQISEPFTVVAPVGGGGLISGLALAAYACAREIRWWAWKPPRLVPSPRRYEKGMSSRSASRPRSRTDSPAILIRPPSLPISSVSPRLRWRSRKSIHYGALCGCSP
jgi:threonine dehydratase